MKHPYTSYAFFLISICLILLLSSCEKKYSTGSFTDPRDGNVYPTVLIGSAEWMAANLRFNPGKQAPDSPADSLAPGAWDINDDTTRRALLGMLYNWETACSVCPPGWHLPSDAEWTEMVDELGGSYRASGKLRDDESGLWNEPNTEASNSSGFSSLPAGIRNDQGVYSEYGKMACYWTSGNYKDDRAWYRTLRNDENRVFRCNGDHYGNKKFGFSVRCVRNK